MNYVFFMYHSNYKDYSLVWLQWIHILEVSMPGNPQPEEFQLGHRSTESDGGKNSQTGR